MSPMASTAARPPGRAINAKIVDLAGTVTKKMLVIQNIKMTFTFKHPKYYKELRASRPASDQDPEASSSKRQASSSKEKTDEKRMETEQNSREDTQ